MVHATALGMRHATSSERKTSQAQLAQRYATSLPALGLTHHDCALKVMSPFRVSSRLRNCADDELLLDVQINYHLGQMLHKSTNVACTLEALDAATARTTTDLNEYVCQQR